MKPKPWEVRVGWNLWEGLLLDFTEALCEENVTWKAYIYTADMKSGNLLTFFYKIKYIVQVNYLGIELKCGILG